MPAVIEIENLTKRYGNFTAVNGISFSVQEGEVLGFLGPNGAGKSTTMNMLTGYISSTSGKALICGYNIMENPDEAKRQIGYLPEIPPLYYDMTVKEYLKFVYDLKKVKSEEGKSRHIARIITEVGLAEKTGRLIKNLSKGYKQRVGLAQALIGDPKVLILDEPTVGLDPRQIIEIRNVIKQLGKQRTILLSTHILQEVSAICDRVVIINRGEIAAMDTIENLSGKAIGGRFQIRAPKDEYIVKNILSGVANIKYIDVAGTKEEGTVDVIVEAMEDTDIRADLFDAFAKNGVPLLMLKPLGRTLEEVFINVTDAASASKETEQDEQMGEQSGKETLTDEITDTADAESENEYNETEGEN